MIRLAVTIAHKELRLEWRSRVLLWQVLPFAVMAMVIAGLAVGPDQSTGRRLAPGLLYLIITLVALQVPDLDDDGLGGFCRRVEVWHQIGRAHV
mgnify:CR=1 FL=1